MAAATSLQRRLSQLPTLLTMIALPAIWELTRSADSVADSGRESGVLIAVFFFWILFVVFGPAMYISARDASDARQLWKSSAVTSACIVVACLSLWGLVSPLGAWMLFTVPAGGLIAAWLVAGIVNPDQVETL